MRIFRSCQPSREQKQMSCSFGWGGILVVTRLNQINHILSICFQVVEVMDEYGKQTRMMQVLNNVKWTVWMSSYRLIVRFCAIEGLS